LKLRTTHGPLLIKVGSLREANILVQEGLSHKGELKNCELFIEDCTVMQSFNCQHYVNNARMCKGKKYVASVLKSMN
jgi:hypothetical protein